MRAKVAKRVAVLGAGPAGLSMAKFLTDAGLSCKVFESNDRVGGKSESLRIGELVVELGTSYTSLEHRTVKKWLRSYGQPLTRLGEARFDGARVVDFVKKGEGKPLLLQILTFMRYLTGLRRRLLKTSPSAEVLTEASMTTLDWIRKLELPKMELALYRLQTAQGYGRLDETSIGQTALWCTPKFIASGVFNRLGMPDQGWSDLWNSVAAEFEVELNSKVLKIVRGADGVDVVQAGRTERFDAIICAIPVDVFAALTDATDAERYISKHVHWTNYTTCLVAADNWFSDHRVSGLSAALAPGAQGGKLIGGRYEGYQEELGGHLYVTGQVSNGLTPQELTEILSADIARQGAVLKSVIRQRVWRYFPRYGLDSMREGILDRLRDMQGEQRTWYTGATFSHELISSIVQFNEALSAKIVAQQYENVKYDRSDVTVS